MNVKDLRVQLETTLSTVLGTYYLANGATTPAIAVRGWGEGLPPGTTVVGLECLIIRDPEPVELVQYQHAKAFDRWTLFLVDWSGAVPLQEVAGQLLWAYPNSVATLVQVPKGVGPRGQMKVELQTNPDSLAMPVRPVKEIRIDTSTSGVIYVGEASYDAAESSTAWSITRSIYNAAGVRTSKGTAVNVTWTGRAGHTYT